MFGSLPARKEARASERIRPRRCVIYFLRLPHNYSALWRCGPLWPPKGFVLSSHAYIHTREILPRRRRKEGSSAVEPVSAFALRAPREIRCIHYVVVRPSVCLAELGGVERTKRQFVMISTGRSSLLPPLARSLPARSDGHTMFRLADIST